MWKNFNKWRDAEIIIHKYLIPRSTLYKILRDDKMGKFPWFNEWIDIMNKAVLTEGEKLFIKSCVTPPLQPQTLDKINLMMNDGFSVKNRKRLI